jgi:hypothetical protein
LSSVTALPMDCNPLTVLEIAVLDDAIVGSTATANTQNVNAFSFMVDDELEFFTLSVFFFFKLSSRCCGGGRKPAAKSALSLFFLCVCSFLWPALALEGEGLLRKDFWAGHTSDIYLEWRV